MKSKPGKSTKEKTAKEPKARELAFLSPNNAQAPANTSLPLRVVSTWPAQSVHFEATRIGSWIETYGQSYFGLEAIRVRFDQDELPQVLRVVVHDKCFFPSRSNDFLIDGQAAIDFVSGTVGVWTLQPGRSPHAVQNIFRQFFLTQEQQQSIQQMLVLPNTSSYRLCGWCSGRMPSRDEFWLHRLFFPEHRWLLTLNITIPRSLLDHVAKSLFGNRQQPRLLRIDAFQKTILSWRGWRDDEYPRGRVAFSASVYLMLLLWTIASWRSTLSIIHWLTPQVRQMEVSLKRVFRSCSARILYNLGHFDAALEYCLVDPQDPIDTQIDSWLEMAMVYAHKNDATAARRARDCAIKLFDFSGKPKMEAGLSQPFYVTYPQQFNRLMLYSLLCYAFLGDESFLTISPPFECTPVSYRFDLDVQEHVNGIVSSPAINGPSFVAWGFEAQARTLLRHIEHRLKGKQAISEIEMKQILDWLDDCRDKIQCGLATCKQYQNLQNVPGLYNTALMLASVTGDQLSQEAGKLIAGLVGFSYHQELNAPGWTIEINEEHLQQIRMKLPEEMWATRWRSFVQTCGLPKELHNIDRLRAAFEPAPDYFLNFNQLRRPVTPKELQFKDMMNFGAPSPPQPSVVSVSDDSVSSVGPQDVQCFYCDLCDLESPDKGHHDQHRHGEPHCTAVRYHLKRAVILIGAPSVVSLESLTLLFHPYRLNEAATLSLALQKAALDESEPGPGQIVVFERLEDTFEFVGGRGPQKRLMEKYPAIEVRHAVWTCTVCRDELAKDPTGSSVKFHSLLLFDKHLGTKGHLNRYKAQSSVQVFGLASTVTPSNLEHCLFKGFKVLEISVFNPLGTVDPPPMMNDTSLQAARVLLDSPKLAQAAVNLLNETWFEGQVVNVRLVPKKPTRQEDEHQRDEDSAPSTSSSSSSSSSSTSPSTSTGGISSGGFSEGRKKL